MNWVYQEQLNRGSRSSKEFCMVEKAIILIIMFQTFATVSGKSDYSQVRRNLTSGIKFFGWSWLISC